MNPYFPHIATIKKIKIETGAKDTKTFDVVIDNEKARIAFKHCPGQFAELSVLGYGEAPISITSAPTRQQTLQFCIKKTGVVTGALHSMSEGEKIGIRGPYGNGFPLEKLKNKNLLFVAGGIGLAPLRSLINYCLDTREDYRTITIVNGARTSRDLVFKDEYPIWEKAKDTHLHLTVDCHEENWTCMVGVVPKVLDEIRPTCQDSVAIVCGPPVMIRFTMPVLLKLGYCEDAIITTLEMRMKCGIGKCGRCNIGSYYVCKDGPVYSLAQLNQMPKEY